MPQDGQRTITFTDDSLLQKLDKVADKEERSLASIVRLCVASYFGNVDEQKKSKEILERMK